MALVRVAIPSLPNASQTRSQLKSDAGTLRASHALAISPKSITARARSNRTSFRWESCVNKFVTCQSAIFDTPIGTHEDDSYDDVDWAAISSSDHLTVGDCMSRGRLIVASPATTVDEALEALVENRITGMPVVDPEGRLVGVVSDYDLLAIDSISGDTVTSKVAQAGMFPEPGRSWKAFHEIQRLLVKTYGKTVADVMTPHPMTVRASTNLDEAARLLLESHHRRLPVVDDTGKLVGLLTRGNVVKAALAMKKAGQKPANM